MFFSQGLCYMIYHNGRSYRKERCNKSFIHPIFVSLFSVCVCVCVCVYWVFTDVYQSEMIIYVWGPKDVTQFRTGLHPRLNQFVTSIVSWIIGAHHNA